VIRAVEVQYFRAPRERWELTLLRAVQAGANTVAVPVPWLHHEIRRGDIDLSEAVDFLGCVRDTGLDLIVHTGQDLGRGLLGDGIPPWLLAEEADPDVEWPRFAAALERALAPFSLLDASIADVRPARDALSVHRILAAPGDGVQVAPFHQADPDPPDVGLGPTWGMEAPVRPDGTLRGRFRPVQQLLLCLEAGGDDLAASTLLSRRTPEPPVEVSIRQGERLRYVTIVNASRGPWTGAIELPGETEVDVRVGGSTVAWAALRGSEPVAALLAGDAARIGPLTVDSGSVAVARREEGWQVVADGPCRVRLPAAVGLDGWRLGFDGAIDALPRDGDVVAWDGSAERVVLGVQPVATAVERFRALSRASADRQAAGLARLAQAVRDPDLAELAESLTPLEPGRLSAISLPRLRFRVSAGTAPAGTAALLAPLAALVRRLDDLSLREP
jgi:hypothetical protein